MHISHSRWKTALIAICLLTLLAGCSIQKGIALPAGSARADRQQSDQSHPQLPDGSEAGDNGEKPDASLEDKPSGEPEPVLPRDDEPEETDEPTQIGGTEAENARALLLIRDLTASLKFCSIPIRTHPPLLPRKAGPRPAGHRRDRHR